MFKSNNIIKKIYGCIFCHKLIKKKNFPNINNIKIKLNFNKLKNFKYFKKYNINMNNIIKNLKKKYLIEISKYFNLFPIIKKLFFIKI